jgi:hypothetical protein
MRSPCVIWLIGIVLVPLIASGQTPRSNYDPATNHPSKQSSGFIDFVLKQLNPRNTDYGQLLEDGRRIAIEATIDDYYFWSNLTAILVLLMTFCIFLRQRALIKRREVSTARLVAWYHNELFGAREQVFELTAKYGQLKGTIEAEIEARLTQKPAKGEAARESSDPLGNIKGSAPNAQSDNERVLREAIKKMEQQAARDKETLSSLRQQITTLSRRLQEEQQKNRSQEQEIVSGLRIRKDAADDRQRL